MNARKPQLRVSVFSDYICPFCYIGSRRLLRLNDTYDVQVNWCSVEIHPDTPATGMNVDQLGYPPQQWQAMMNSLQRMAQEEGIELAERMFTTNSHRALLLAEVAKTAGRALFYALHERLFSAFFVEAENIGDEAVLRRLAADVDMDAALVDRAWQDSRFERNLAHYLRLAQAAQVRGTPTYVFGEEVIRGAVEVETLRAAAGRLANAS
jgi:predicted DsbA family dithiol-disulfide isomerase